MNTFFCIDLKCSNYKYILSKKRKKVVPKYNFFCIDLQHYILQTLSSPPDPLLVHKKRQHPKFPPRGRNFGGTTLLNTNITHPTVNAGATLHFYIVQSSEAGSKSST